jgi:hypothetical protein
MMIRAARGLAILIVILALVDPAISIDRTTRPLVSIVAAAPDDTTLARRLGQRLNADYEVVAGPFNGASATVLAGRRLPSNVEELATPFFAVIRERSSPAVTIEYIDTPRRASLKSRIPLVVGLHVTEAVNRSVEVTLRSGAVLAGRVVREMASNDERLAIPVSFVAPAAGTTPLHITVTIDGEAMTAGDAAVEIDDERYRVLFLDARPSWMSTFVRRSIERDARFLVSSRTITSREISTETGQPPTLEDRGAIDEYDVVVIGAPDGLRDRDARALDRFMRERGGSVVLLLERRAPGAHDQLLGVTAWQAATHDGGVALDALSGDSMDLRASELLWPAVLPPNVRLVAQPRGRGSADPVLWETAIGTGRLIVSGALDAWRYRDPSVSGFDDLWRSVLAGAAAAAPPALDLGLEQRVLAPGGKTNLRVTVRDIALSARGSGESARTALAAVIEETGDSLRLWPVDGAGMLLGNVEAPNEPGVYRVVVSADDARDTTTLIVMNGARAPVREEPELVAMWARAHGGVAIPESAVDSVPALLDAVLRPEARRVPWHPMRSAWWIVPFALALGVEWWWRRRRGLA